MRGFVMLGLLIVTLLPQASYAQEAKRRPNILWITCEDSSPNLGCYGDKFAVTPNLDAFAKTALRYRTAWSNAPVCAPARTTIISGLYAPSTGSEHMRSLVRLPVGIEMFPVLLKRLGYYCTNNVKEDYNLAKTGKVWDESSAKAHYKNRPKGVPFFAVFNFVITHESQIRKRPHKLVLDPSKVPIPPYHPDTPEVRHDWTQLYDNLTVMDRMVGQMLAELESLGLAEDTIVFFYSDHGSGMPRSKRTALDSGLHVPMLVRIPEKFRDLRPNDYAAGGITDRLVSFVDLAPTVLSLAGSPAPPTMEGMAFLGTHAAPPREYVFGFRGRMDERYDLVRSVRDQRFVYSHNYLPYRVAGQHNAYMFETPTTMVWKKLFDAGKLNEVQAQFWSPRPAEQLFDVIEDPYETRNLAESRKHQADLKRLRVALAQKVRSTRDVGFLPEDEMHRRAKNRTPYEVGKDDFDVERIIGAAELASDTRQADDGRLKKAIQDKDAAVRYWGVVGIYGRGKNAVTEERSSLAALVQGDAAPCVRIVAAEALGKYGDNRERKLAIDALLPLTSLRTNDVFVSLQALNALDYLEVREDEGWSVIRTAAETNAKIEPRVNALVPRVIEHIGSRFSKTP